MGVLDRLVLGDGAWERIAPLIIGRPGQKGSTGRDNRMFVEGILWLVRTGAPWRDVPVEFGEWNSVYRRFSRWSHKGVWERVFAALSDDPDFEYLILDSTVVRAHQHAAGAKKGGLAIRRLAARGRPEHQDPPRRARARLPRAPGPDRRPGGRRAPGAGRRGRVARRDRHRRHGL